MLLRSITLSKLQCTKFYLYSEKNWAVYDNEPLPQSKAYDRGNSRSLVNDDINGAQPKRYGGTNNTLVNSFAGISSGMKEKLQQRDVPWGSGENFEHTKYGSKSWAEKPNRYPAHGNVPVVQPIRPSQRDALDYERDRIESRGAQGNDYSYQAPEPVQQPQKMVSMTNC